MKKIIVFKLHFSTPCCKFTQKSAHFVCTAPQVSGVWWAKVQTDNFQNKHCLCFHKNKKASFQFSAAPCLVTANIEETG